jgi:hypothetical protein
MYSTRFDAELESLLTVFTIGARSQLAETYCVVVSGAKSNKGW